MNQLISIDQSETLKTTLEIANKMIEEKDFSFKNDIIAQFLINRVTTTDQEKFLEFRMKNMNLKVYLNLNQIPGTDGEECKSIILKFDIDDEEEANQTDSDEESKNPNPKQSQSVEKGRVMDLIKKALFSKIKEINSKVIKSQPKSINKHLNLKPYHLEKRERTKSILSGISFPIKMKK